MLGASGIASGLAAAEGRADLSTLAAVGASPGLRRRLAASQAVVTGGLGTLLGTAAGLVPAVGLNRAPNAVDMTGYQRPAPFPSVEQPAERSARGAAARRATGGPADPQPATTAAAYRMRPDLVPRVRRLAVLRVRQPVPCRCEQAAGDAPRDARTHGQPSSGR